MSETVYVEVMGRLVPLPVKGDIVAIRHESLSRELRGVCVATDSRSRHGKDRSHIVKVLIEGQVMLIPVDLIEIVK